MYCLPGYMIIIKLPPCDLREYRYSNLWWWQHLAKRHSSFYTVFTVHHVFHCYRPHLSIPIPALNSHHFIYILLICIYKKSRGVDFPQLALYGQPHYRGDARHSLVFEFHCHRAIRLCIPYTTRLQMKACRFNTRRGKDESTRNSSNEGVLTCSGTLVYCNIYNVFEIWTHFSQRWKCLTTYAFNPVTNLKRMNCIQWSKGVKRSKVASTLLAL